MPILNKNGKALSQKEVRTLITMMQGSYDSFIDRFKDSRKLQLGAMFCDGYKKRRDELERSYLELASSEKNIDVGELIKNEYSNTNRSIMEKNIQNIHNIISEPTGNEYDFYNEAILASEDPYALKINGSINGNTVEPSSINTDEGYQTTAGSFKLADVPMEGIKDIVNYNPNRDRIADLHTPRSGNSNTLAQNKNKERNESIFKFDSAAELSRIRSSELISKMAKGEDISFTDLFDAFSSLNEMTRIGDAGGGKLRSKVVRAGNIYGVGPAVVPYTLYKTLNTIAESMNIIRKTVDPDLRRTRAIQLAAFAYSMTLSEHVFEDGNGRSCRLLADTILQSFGLPPHIPSKEQSTHDVVGTISESLDFDQCAKVFFDNVKKSSDALVGKFDKSILKRDEYARLREKGAAYIQEISKSSKLPDDLLDYIDNLDVADFIDPVIYNSAESREELDMWLEDNYKLFAVYAHMNEDPAFADQLMNLPGDKGLRIRSVLLRCEAAAGYGSAFLDAAREPGFVNNEYLDLSPEELDAEKEVLLSNLTPENTQKISLIEKNKEMLMRFKHAGEIDELNKMLLEADGFNQYDHKAFENRMISEFGEIAEEMVNRGPNRYTDSLDNNISNDNEEVTIELPDDFEERSSEESVQSKEDEVQEPEEEKMVEVPGKYAEAYHYYTSSGKEIPKEKAMEDIAAGLQVSRQFRNKRFQTIYNFQGEKGKTKYGIAASKLEFPEDGSPDQLISRLKDFRDDLSDTDPWYKLNNSKAFKDLKKGVKAAITLTEKFKKYPTESNRQRLQDHLDNMAELADSYSDKKFKDFEKSNEMNDKRRSDVAGGFRDFIYTVKLNNFKALDSEKVENYLSDLKKIQVNRNDPNMMKKYLLTLASLGSKIEKKDPELAEQKREIALMIKAETDKLGKGAKSFLKEKCGLNPSEIKKINKAVLSAGVPLKGKVPPAPQKIAEVEAPAAEKNEILF